MAKASRIFKVFAQYQNVVSVLAAAINRMLHQAVSQKNKQ